MKEVNEAHPKTGGPFFVEEWRVIKRNPNYAISNLGRVKSLINKTNTWNGKILKLGRGRKDYVRICLGKYGGYHSVHALVFEAFNGPIPNGKQCNHKDGDKKNNRPENLEYITCLENHLHASLMGLKCRGEKVWNSKLSQENVLDIFKKIENKISCAEISRGYGVTPEAISSIKNGKTWRWLNAEQVL